MKLLNLTKCYVLAPEKTKEHGQVTTKWTFKTECFLSLQQDINELDVNNAGYVDYEIVKARTDKKLDIEKNDGILLSVPTVLDGYVVEKPKHSITGKLTTGKATVYTLKIYHGE